MEEINDTARKLKIYVYRVYLNHLPTRKGVIQYLKGYANTNQPMVDLALIIQRTIFEAKF